MIGDPGRPPSLPPETTAEADRKTAGQRHINRVWETTQAVVTVLITIAAITNALLGVESDVINFAFVAVISSYYARTNHTMIGGVGPKYEGR